MLCILIVIENNFQDGEKGIGRKEEWKCLIIMEECHHNVHVVMKSIPNFWL